MKQRLKLGFPVLGWIFFGLYAGIILSLFALGYSGRFRVKPIFGGTGIPDYIVSVFDQRHDLKWTMILVIITFCSQALFIFGSGRIEVCRPIRRRRLLFPLAVASLFATGLVWGGLLALGELYAWPGIFMGDSFLDPRGCVTLGVVWLFWGVAFYVWLKDGVHLQVLRRLLAFLFAGSLLELMLVIPSHLIAVRKTGCMAGLGTGVGISVGAMVMFWAFGPAALVFAFSRKAVRALRGEMKANRPAPR